jgi:hypothetical protein
MSKLGFSVKELYNPHVVFLNFIHKNKLHVKFECAIPLKYDNTKNYNPVSESLAVIMNLILYMYTCHMIRMMYGTVDLTKMLLESNHIYPRDRRDSG